MRGVTTAESDKFYKTTEHRRERRAVRFAIQAGKEAPPPKAFGDPWRGHKDGKIWCRDRPEIIRK